MVQISEVRINHYVNPVGIGRLEEAGWKIISDERDIRQKAYELQISEDDTFRRNVFESGTVISEESVHVTEGLADIILKSSAKYYVRVRITTVSGEITPWKTGFFVTVLRPDEWKAEMIAPRAQAEDDSSGYYLRKKFVLRQRVRQAYAHVTAFGLYHFYLNGKKAGDDEFTPGWTSYQTHLLYQTYDVTELLAPGENMAGAMLGAGWFKSPMRFPQNRNIYGDRIGFACQIEIEYENGERESVITDDSWRWAHSPVLYSEIYNGEVYDARREIKDWNVTEGDKGQWERAEQIEFNINTLTAQCGCRVKEMERVYPKRIFRTPKGEQVIDFGQNLTGWVECRAEGRPGDRIVLQCFETLDEKGNVYTRNLRTAKQTIVYICDGEEKIYHPNFTYQGFQYVYVYDYPGELRKENFTACVIYSDMEQNGKFWCSNPLVEQLHHNILWGMKGNFLDVPTDCPQRDERLGWTGDAQIFCRTACYLMNTDDFFRKWLVDLKADQREDGAVSNVVPDIYKRKYKVENRHEWGVHGAAGWSDAAVIIPWTLYQMYGDTQVIHEQYQSMKGWIDFVTSRADGCIWKYMRQFGDWVALDAEDGSYYGATPLELTNAAYYVYSTGLFVKMARKIGEDKDADRYEELYEKIRGSYFSHFFDENGRMKVKTQTAHILSLAFGLVPEGCRKNVADDLVGLLKRSDYHLVTGFMGTPYFCQVLSENGYFAEAYTLLQQEEYPSWLYQVKAGATTVWEHLDGKKPDGTMWDPEMNSFNHYAYGAVGEWLYRQAAGIECSEEEPGFKKIVLVPHAGAFSYAGAAYESLYGRILSEWKIEDGVVHLSLEIPCNTAAVVRPVGAEELIDTDGLLFEKTEMGFQALAGSGKYEIIYSV